MARHIGHFPLSGRLGSVVFRKNPDGSVTVANYNAVSKERMQTGDSFKRTRENLTEFSAARLAKEVFTLASPALFKNMHTNKTARNFETVLKKVVRRGPGTRGQRELQVFPNAGRFKNFEWVDSDNYRFRFAGPGTLVAAPSRDDVTWTVAPFNAADLVTPPTNATHFQLVLNIMVLSDYTFSITDQEYQPVNPGINGQSATVRSAPIGVTDNIVAPIILNAALSGVVMPPNTAGLITSLGIEFLQDVNGVMFTFAQKNAMAIAEVY